MALDPGSCHVLCINCYSCGRCQGQQLKAALPEFSQTWDSKLPHMLLRPSPLALWRSSNITLSCRAADEQLTWFPDIRLSRGGQSHVTYITGAISFRDISCVVQHECSCHGRAEWRIRPAGHCNEGASRKKDSFHCEALPSRWQASKLRTLLLSSYLLRSVLCSWETCTTQALMPWTLHLPLRLDGTLSVIYKQLKRKSL